MAAEELKKHFTQSVLIWENALDVYPGEFFLLKENEQSWSIGQVYQHLVELTGNILRLAEKLNTSNENALEEKTETGKLVFTINNMGGGTFEAPASIRYPVQPQDKEKLRTELSQLKERFNLVYDATMQATLKGKYKHPFLGFLNAMEWLQFTEMHLRHHLLQKERIDNFIKASQKQEL